ncbi:MULTISPECIES: hypothetical protein [unclassified Ochrobactrum]|uniref:hypothetical protein n=1 Tax=unclassified Ochrobactrum TaxID=239106 RepID=UPI003099C1F7
MSDVMMKHELIHEVWLNPELDGQMLPGMCLVGPMGDSFRQLLNEGAEKIAEITGHSHFHVMTKYWALQGWGKYHALDQQDYEPYPSEWISVQRIFLDSV